MRAARQKTRNGLQVSRWVRRSDQQATASCKAINIASTVAQFALLAQFSGEFRVEASGFAVALGGAFSLARKVAESARAAVSAYPAARSGYAGGRVLCRLSVRGLAGGGC